MIPNETDLKVMLDAGHETFVRVFSQDAKMDKEALTMARYVDAEKLEKDGWSASRTYQQDAKTMVYEKAKMTDFPTADVVEGKTYRELLKAAKKMHLWIFLNSVDESEAYDECGLTDEMNALLGYGDSFTVKMDGGADDAVDN